MGRITSDDIRYKLEEINSILGKKYALEHPKKRRDWRTYEQEFAQRIKTAMRDLDPLVNEAVSAICSIWAGHRIVSHTPLFRVWDAIIFYPFPEQFQDFL